MRHISNCAKILLFISSVGRIFVHTVFFITRHEFFITYKSSTTFYPPRPLPGAGIRSTFMTIITMLLNVSQFTHYNNIVTWFTVLAYYIPSINIFTCSSDFWFWCFQFFTLDCVLWYGNMSTEYGTFVGTSFDIRMARVRCQGELSPPPPVTRPPPG
jgi:hypothetical protein